MINVVKCLLEIGERREGFPVAVLLNPKEVIQCINMVQAGSIRSETIYILAKYPLLIRFEYTMNFIKYLSFQYCLMWQILQLLFY